MYPLSHTHCTSVPNTGAFAIASPRPRPPAPGFMFLHVPLLLQTLRSCTVVRVAGTASFTFAYITRAVQASTQTFSADVDLVLPNAA